MGTVNNEARDIAPSVTKQEMQAKQGNTILTPEFRSSTGQSSIMSFKRMMILQQMEKTRDVGRKR